MAISSAVYSTRGIGSPLWRDGGQGPSGTPSHTGPQGQSPRRCWRQPLPRPASGRLTACTGRLCWRSASFAGGTPGPRSPAAEQTHSGRSAGACDSAGGRGLRLPGAGRTLPGAGRTLPGSAGDPAHHPGHRFEGRGWGQPSGEASAHRVIQVEVRVKLGDQVVTLVQLRDFPWEPEDFTVGGRKEEPGERGAVGACGPPWSSLPRPPGMVAQARTQVRNKRARASRRGSPSHTTRASQVSPLGASAPQCPGLVAALRTEELTSPFLSLGPRTSSATLRTELSRLDRSALGTSQRTKYSRWGPPSRGFWAGRVSRWRIWASNV